MKKIILGIMLFCVTAFAAVEFRNMIFKGTVLLESTLEVDGAVDLNASLEVGTDTVLVGDLTVDATTFFVDASGNNIGVGTITPNANTILDVVTTTKSSRPAPSMSEAQRDLLTPVAGALIYNTDSSTFNYYDGGSWSEVGGTGGSGSNNAYNVENVGFEFVSAASAVTITMKQADGSTDCSVGNPCKISFDNGDGSYTEITTTSDTSVTLDSGATLNTTNGNAHPIFIYAVNNSGVIAWAVSTKFWDQKEALNITLLDTSADGVGLYSDSALTSKRIKLMAIWFSTQTTAGTWDATTGTKLIDQVLINSFLKLSSAGVRNGFEVRAACDHSGTPACAETDNYNWVSSVTDNAVGQLTINAFSGITFKGCRASCGGTCWTTAFAAVGATTAGVRSFTTAGAADIATTYVTCIVEAY